jgi:serine/threonine-protein kinase
MDTDRNLLFAVLALQAGLIDRDRFVQACTLWATRKDIAIADLLVEQGWLRPAAREMAERLLQLNMEQHGGDVRASLAAAAGVEARSALASVADADVERSLAALPAGRTNPDRMALATEDFSTVPPAGSAGRNLLYEEIGRGGMGRVLRGRDPQLRRDLAVKVLREEYRDDATVQRRFVEEAQVGGQLQHPGVVPVYELGQFGDGRPFFTMKLVKGRTLADLLKERPSLTHDLPRFLTIFEQTCQALGYAHSKGVIHRDLKPSNIMVGAFGEVQVMDWGLAKVLGCRSAADPEATTAGTLIRTLRSDSTAEEDGRTGVVGTPSYMAPEQARGEVDAVDEGADVFGLGGILCAILTGQPPFVAASNEDTLRKAVGGELAEAFARLDRCGADAELVTVCKWCLAPERGQRPAEAGAVAARMAAYQAAVQQRLRKAELERTAAQARAEEARATAAAERKARRRTWALAAAMLALVVVGAGGGLLVQRRAVERRQLVESALEKATGLRERARWREAQAVLGQARLVLGDTGQGDLRRRLDAAETELTLVNRLDAIRQHRATIINNNFDAATAAHAYAAAFREADLGEVGDDEAAVAARVRASRVSGTLVAALDDWAASEVTKPEARAWLLGVARRASPDPWGDRFRDPALWGDRQALRALADDALRNDGSRLGELSPQVLEALGWLLIGNGAEAVPLLRAAQSRYPNDFWLSLALGIAFHKAKQDAEAVGYYRVAVALRPDAAAAHHNLGAALHDKGDLEGAIAEYRTAIALEPGLANVHFGLGAALLAKQDVNGAIAEFRQAIDLAPKLAKAHIGLGAALCAKQDLDGAIVYYRQAIDLAPTDAIAHYNLGNILRDKKDLNGAIAEYRKAIALDLKLAAAHYNLGNALRDKQQLDAAIEEYRKAIALDPKLAPAHNNLGLALKDKRQLDAAIEEYRKAIALNPTFAEPHCNLGEVLIRQGRFAESLDEFRRGHDLGSRRPGWPYPSGDWVQQAEQFVALNDKLPAFLSGKAEPANASERVWLAQLCGHFKQRPAAAARFYADAFAADPKLADDLQQSHRYNAVCCAALAAAGQGQDAKNLPDKVPLMWRRQALGWLRADLAQYQKLAERPEPQAKQTVRQRLEHWQQDADLVSVRDKAALDKLPDNERQQWRQLWDDVAALLKKVEPR